MMSFESRLVGLRVLAAQIGWINTLWYGLARALGAVSGGKIRLIKYYFMAQPIAPAAVLGKPSATMRVSCVGPEADCIREFPRPAEVLSRRFGSGAICLVAQGVDDRLCGFLWFQERQYEEDEVHSLFIPSPADKAVWDYDVYVEPRYRIGRTFLRLWDAAHELMWSKGYRWTLSRISAFKSDSLRSHARLGAIQVGSATYLCIGMLQISLLSLAPYIHVGFGERHRPVVRIHTPALHVKPQIRGRP